MAYSENLTKEWVIDPNPSHSCCFTDLITTVEGLPICEVSEPEYVPILFNAPKMLKALEMVLYECQDTPDQLAVAALGIISMRVKAVVDMAKQPYTRPEESEPPKKPEPILF